MAVGEAVIDQFTYTIRLGNGTLSTATVTFEVRNAAEQPESTIATRPDGGFVQENQATYYEIVENDTGDGLSVTAISSIDVVSSNAQLNGADVSAAYSIENNRVEFNPGTLFDALANGETATVRIVTTVTDINGNTAPSALTVWVTGESGDANETAYNIATSPDGGFVGENQATYFDIVGNDSGNELQVADITGFVVISSNSAINGIDASSAFTIANNRIEYDPGMLFDALEDGETATIRAVTTVTDINGYTAQSALTVWVAGDGMELM